MESNFTQISTLGGNKPQGAIYPVLSKNSYECANAHITRGAVMTPWTLDECLSSFPGILEIAKAIGFVSGSCGGECGGECGGVSFDYNLFEGTGSTSSPNIFKAQDMYFTSPTTECEKITTMLGLDWLGCAWGTPEASYSCTCPDIGPKYEAYLKLRLNVASFWNTPVETPVKRAEFVDALQYGRKVDVTIPGDFSIKVGKVVRLRVNGMSGYPYSSYSPSLNGLYYIVGIKHVITNSGTHESALALSKIAPETTASLGGAYYS